MLGKGQKHPLDGNATSGRLLFAPLFHDGARDTFLNVMDVDRNLPHHGMQ